MKLYHVSRIETAKRRCRLLKAAFPDRAFYPVPAGHYGWNIATTEARPVSSANNRRTTLVGRHAASKIKGK